MQLIRRPAYDVNDRPFLIIWETTQACDLACRHCRAESSPNHDPSALSFEEGCRLIDQIDDFRAPHPLFILTGGDPFKRKDIYDLVSYSAQRGIPAAVSPSGTPLLNPTNLQHLHECGTRVISLSLDGSNPAVHDEFRRVPGSFDWTVNGWKAAQQAGLKLQINTTVTRYNLFDLPDIFALVRDLGAMTWSLFFLIPTGRAQAEDEISPEDYEAVMNFLYDASKYIGLKTTEGHHYKRILLQRAALESINIPYENILNLNGTYHQLMDGLKRVTHGEPAPSVRTRRTPMHVNSAQGFVFISLKGDVFPSGYLPLKAGSVRETSLPEIYRESPLFRSLRDRDQLKGRCGHCEFRWICGGSRSRAYAVHGDVLAEEPFCAYQPGSFPYLSAIERLGDDLI